MSPIQDFYSHQTVFLTGATGLIGKLIVEKLLRTCPDIEKIYLLVRKKYDKSEEERFKSIFEQPCFDLVRAHHQDFRRKIHLLSGDCGQPNLGLNERVQEILKNEVTCVIHAAANTKFDTDLRTAVYTHVRCLRDLLRLATDMKKLKAFVHVSTAFSHCIRKDIDEEFYEVDVNPDKLIRMVEIFDDRMLEVVTPHIMGKWPNTYVYTKAVTEELIRSHKQTLPIAIVRPAVVTSTNHEPIPGWIEHFTGVVGVVTGAALGVLRSIHADVNAPAYMVPADHVVNNILAAAWAIEKDKDEVKIYNFVGCKTNAITLGDLVDKFMKFAFIYPLNSAVWYSYIKMSRHRWVYKLRSFFLHTVFSYLVDCFLLFAGKTPIAIEKYRKINKLLDAISFFTTNQWEFSTKNVDALWEKMEENDRKLFNFNMKNLNWDKYIEASAIGGRIYLMKDPLETLPQAKRKMYILALIHYIFVALAVYSLYRVLRPFWNVVF